MDKTQDYLNVIQLLKEQRNNAYDQLVDSQAALIKANELIQAYAEANEMLKTKLADLQPKDDIKEKIKKVN
jgi:hypothetical protein